MDNKAEITGFIGGTEQQLKSFLQKEGNNYSLIVDFNRSVDVLMEPGAEGHRQIINYFGDDFLSANLKVNKRKLSKFIGTDVHKKRIFAMLMEPIFFNYLQSLRDANKGGSILAVIPVLQNKKYEQRFTTIIRA